MIDLSIEIVHFFCFSNVCVCVLLLCSLTNVYFEDGGFHNPLIQPLIPPFDEIETRERPKNVTTDMPAIAIRDGPSKAFEIFGT